MFSPSLQVSLVLDSPDAEANEVGSVLASLGKLGVSSFRDLAVRHQDLLVPLLPPSPATPLSLCQALRGIADLGGKWAELSPAERAGLDRAIGASTEHARCTAQTLALYLLTIPRLGLHWSGWEEREEERGERRVTLSLHTEEALARGVIRFLPFMDQQNLCNTLVGFRKLSVGLHRYPSLSQGNIIL